MLKNTYLALLFLLIFFSPVVFADNSTGFAWGENIGWIESGDLNVTDTNITGNMYSGNIGWISFSCENTDSCGDVEYGVVNDSGDISGFAWGENTGWIDMSGVVIDSNTGDFSGYGYSGNIGWISFSCENTDSCGDVDYGVNTTWRITENESSSSSRTTSSVRRRVINLEKLGKEEEANELRTKFNIENNEQKIVRSDNRLLSIINILINSGVIPQDKADMARSLANKPSGYDFTINLDLGDINEEVRLLQKFLNENGYVIAETGPGSVGNETNIFGPLTQNALIEFQKANRIVPSVGYFGPITRSFINNNY
jgi:hypothetical protein